MIHELKLLNIHKRNAEILAQQKAHHGLHCPMHVQSQLNHELEQISELESYLQRRLNELLQKSAIYGISADPSITIEIEDIQNYFKENK